ncbi:hypothetical protein oki361_16650 [Helicobacter pylori]
MNECIFNKENQNENSKYRIRPKVSDDNVLLKLLDSKPIEDIDKKSNVYTNYLFFYEELEKQVKNNDLNKENVKFIKDTLNRIEIFSLKLDNEKYNIQEIFETINSAGIRLTEIDLIRNKILLNLDSKTQDKIYEI